jgi:hypothetical protein
VYDPPEAKLKRRPYAVRLHTTDATAEQLVTGVTLLGILGNRLSNLTNERYPGALASFLRGDQVLKYGKGQVTDVEDAEGAPVRPWEQEEEDAPAGRPTPGQVPRPDMDR